MEPDRGGMRALLAGKLTPPARIYASNRASGRTIPAASVDGIEEWSSGPAAERVECGLVRYWIVRRHPADHASCPTGAIMKVRFGVSVISGTAFPHRRDPEKICGMGRVIYGSRGEFIGAHGTRFLRGGPYFRPTPLW